MSYIGVPPFGQTVRTITELTASAGQTTFNVSGGYLPGYVDVFLNGVSLASGDFTSTNGSTVVLGAAASLNDEFKAIAYWPVSLIDTYRKAEADALLAARVGTTSSVSMRNRIINGDMRIDQRNAGAAVTVNAGGNVYTLDRWSFIRSTAGSYAVQQSTTAPSGFAASLGVTNNTAGTPAAGDYNFFLQAIEGFNVSDLGWGTASAQAITLSFQVRASAIGTYGGCLRNAAGNRSYPFTFTVAAANTFEVKAITIPGDTTGTWLTTNGKGIEVDFDLGSGATFRGTAGAWASGNFVGATGASQNMTLTSGATFYITGVQLEAGTVATPFERRDYGRELMMCQRYYETGSGYQLYSGYVENTAVYYNPVRFTVTKRAAPLVATTYIAASRFAAAAPTAAYVNPDGFYAQASATITGTGYFQYSWVATAEL